MQRLQRIHDSRGGKFDGEVREIMILVELGSVGQDMEGVWGMRSSGGGLEGRLCPPWWQSDVECVLHSSALFDVRFGLR